MQSKVMTFPEFLQVTGWSRAYAYKMKCQGKIPGVSKPNGGKLYFSREAIENWLLSNPQPTAEERKQQAASYVATNK
jgi:predicted DNA-binding transcriptional regulator AlpA